MRKIKYHHRSLWSNATLNGALILSVASLISKILSAVYRVPFQNLVGNVGFYIYQQVYPIYGVLMTLALTGLPIFISKIMVEQENEIKRRNLYLQLLITLTILGMFAFIAMQILAPWLAIKMGDINLTSLIRGVSLLLILMPFLAATRGFFQGSFHMQPTAVSQVLEQIFRVGFIIIVAITAHFHHWNLYRMGTDAMLAAFFAGILAVLVLSYYLKAVHFKFSYHPEMPYQVLLKRLVNEGGILCVLASLVVLMQLVDSFTIKKNLLIYGLSNFQAQNAKGIYDRAQPLVQLGLVVGTGFATSFIPSLVQAYRSKHLALFRRNAQMMVQISMGLTFAIAMVMISLIHSINILLFKQPDEDLTIAIYCLGMIIATMIVIHNSVLQSLNLSKITWLAISIGIGIKIVFAEMLTKHLGIVGGSLSTVIALAVIWLINYITASEFIKNSLYSGQFFIKIFIITLIGGLGLFELQHWLQMLFVYPSRLNAFWMLVILIPAGIFVFLGLSIIFRLFTGVSFNTIFTMVKSKIKR